MDSSKYKDYILTMLFVKYVSDFYKEKLEELKARFGDNEERIQKSLKREEFISRLSGIIVGIRDGKQISYTDFGEMYLPLPPIEEQNKIAEILMLSDKEIELLKKTTRSIQTSKERLNAKTFNWRS